MQYTNIYDFAKQEVHPVYIRCGYWSDPDSQADNDNAIAEIHGCWSRSFDCYGNCDIFDDEHEALQWTIHNLACGVLRTLDFCVANGITSIDLFSYSCEYVAEMSIAKLSNKLNYYICKIEEIYQDDKFCTAMYVRGMISIASSWADNRGIDIRHEMEDELEFLKNEVAGGMK